MGTDWPGSPEIVNETPIIKNPKSLHLAQRQGVIKAFIKNLVTLRITKFQFHCASPKSLCKAFYSQQMLT